MDCVFVLSVCLFFWGFIDIVVEWDVVGMYVRVYVCVGCSVRFDSDRIGSDRVDENGDGYGDGRMGWLHDCAEDAGTTCDVCVSEVCFLTILSFDLIWCWREAGRKGEENEKKCGFKGF